MKIYFLCLILLVLILQRSYVYADEDCKENQQTANPELKKLLKLFEQFPVGTNKTDDIKNEIFNFLTFPLVKALYREIPNSTIFQNLAPDVYKFLLDQNQYYIFDDKIADFSSITKIYKTSTQIKFMNHRFDPFNFCALTSTGKIIPILENEKQIGSFGAYSKYDHLFFKQKNKEGSFKNVKFFCEIHENIFALTYQGYVYKVLPQTIFYTNIEAMACSRHSMAVITRDGNLRTKGFGFVSAGGNNKGLDKKWENQFVNVFANPDGFAALTKNHTLVRWGKIAPSFRFKVVDGEVQRADSIPQVKMVYVTEGAFVAQDFSDKFFYWSHTRLARVYDVTKINEKLHNQTVVKVVPTGQFEELVYDGYFPQHDKFIFTFANNETLDVPDKDLTTQNIHRNSRREH